MTFVSRETQSLLQRYLELLEKWNARINLVSPRSLVDAGQRHIRDCLQVAEVASDVSGHWVDLGSGGGLPGLILAIALAEADLSFTLIESDQRKVAFLRTVVRELALTNTAVIAERIEHAPPQEADHVSARALASLDRLLPMVERHLAPNGTAWLMKGRSWGAECASARHQWQFDLEAFPSNTDADAAILKISGVSAHG
ncbi:16S rRNA (guanine(527)-N(7))-methyltransferase RsmG [Paracoccus beibuensis]|uniref:16S rRNA (guanine(527)-N(7))-methyltransferase RsmG n=1 Tax=Paracoccus beibuensis TaxID=547602 RepID=UPI00223EE2FE|nr:16S rRNA (guanine(527)-N(7))-methyltransferase RsmG [Paracoccus beibuensis]